MKNIGDNTAQNILDNCYVWNYLKTSNEVTAEKISKKLGSYTTSSWSESNSSSGGAVNKSNSMNLTQRPLLTTDEVLRIERPYLLVMCSGLSPAMTYSPDLSKWKFNEILGLGNKSWNTKVREYRETHRNIRKITPLKLWNIADQTKEFKKVLQKKQLMEEKARRMKNINLEGKL
ncbi:MAG: type IV secretory system conjugative DNA transfer family protein [Clostridia bacterium]|nr:type IV secretory system conjugative DNA transfer family protein [Clostridia bacterium]